jgi:hypothetical protein
MKKNKSSTDNYMGLCEGVECVLHIYLYGFLLARLVLKNIYVNDRGKKATTITKLLLIP